ncbi:phage upper tail fiber protein [Mesorhizobium carmichaelinearum]|uniref:phage upper tail fiber protein n=1 Tax=Mesorhizobium carmichaelinearum TaxID=1208188 RepID=UPI000BA3FA2C|nr:hypothetical protein [Mesorhizobium carmichaelinearum]
MSTLPATGLEVISLPPYSAISITVAGGAGSGSIERLGNNPGEASFGEVALTASTTIGPFPVPTRHLLRCSPANHLSYTVAAADFPAVTSGVERIVNLSQAEYEALSPPDAATLYLIVG